MLRFSLLARLEIPSQNNKNLSSSSKNPHLHRVNCGFSSRVGTKFSPQNSKKGFWSGRFWGCFSLVKCSHTPSLLRFSLLTRRKRLFYSQKKMLIRTISLAFLFVVY